MGKFRYHNKAPYSTLHPSPEHWTRKGNSWKQKVCYESEDEACEFLNQNPILKAIGYTCYLCKVCSKWHVGRVRKEKQEKRN